MEAYVLMVWFWGQSASLTRVDRYESLAACVKAGRSWSEYSNGRMHACVRAGER